MGLVFVHGVNNRSSDPDYPATTALIATYARQLLAPQLGIDPANLFFPYWGDAGARLRWGGVSLPPPGKAQALAIGRSLPEEIGVTLDREEDPTNGRWIADLARRDFPMAVELLLDAISEFEPECDEHSAIAHFARHAYSYLDQNAQRQWALREFASNVEFLDDLTTAIAYHQYCREVPLGLTPQPGFAREVVERLVQRPAAAVTSAILALQRDRIRTSATRFVGDSYEYLATRGTRGTEGEIVRIVADAIQAAMDCDPREPLIVIGHSFGGVIAHDVLCHFRPELVVDQFVTVASQVGLFAELNLLVGRGSVDDRLALPANIRNWLNVYDDNDIFATTVEEVFSRAADYRYATGYGFPSAHGGYFRRPSFYRRLVRRLQGDVSG